MFVPREEARLMLDAYAANGAPRVPAVTVAGIPIMPEFARRAAESPKRRRDEAAAATCSRARRQPLHGKHWQSISMAFSLARAVEVLAVDY